MQGIDKHQRVPPEIDPSIGKNTRYLKKIAKNASISAVGTIFGLILAPISGIITTRALGAEFYGIYSLATYWTNLFGGISTVGFGTTTTRYVASYNGEGRLDKLKGALLLSLKTSLIISGFFTGAIFIFAEPFCSFVLKRPDVAPAFRFFSSNIFLTALYTIFLAGLTGFQEQRYVVLTSSILGSIAKIISLVTLLFFGFRLYAALASSLVQDIIVLSLSALFLIKIFPNLFKKNPVPVTERKELWKFSGTTFATSIFNRYAYQFDILFLSLYRSVAEVGIYSVALRLQPLIYMPHYVISQIFGPIVAELSAKKELNELKSIYKTVTKWTATFSVPIFLTIALFHGPILAMFGREFKGAASALIILGLGNSFADIFGLSGQVIVMSGRPGLNLINSIISSTVGVGIYVMLIPNYGLIGAACGYALSMFLINCIRVAQVYFIFKIHPIKASLGKVFLSAAIASLAAYFFQAKGLLGTFSFAWILYLVFFWLFYGVLLWTLRFDDADKMIIYAMKRRIMRQ